MITVIVEYETNSRVNGENVHKLKQVQVKDIKELDEMFGESKYFILEMETHDTQN